LLASGGDDSMVLVWDLMGQAVGGVQGQVVGGVVGGGGGGGERGPGAAWSCDYEINNLSWAPVGDTLGVCGGRGFWGVQL
jgi:DDB1- and CUL4-associated factor 7